MVARGKLTHIEVRAALDAQSRAGSGKIGEWFEKLGFASEQDVTGALALQWGCPLASSFDLTAVTSPGSIPLTILEAFQMLPVNHASATGTLYLAFGERVDHAALYAIERTLNCRTQPCVARRKGVARQLESMHLLSRPNDVEFVTRDLNEMARISLSYVSRLGPEEVRMNRVGRFIWLRFKACTSAPNPVPTASSATNLVFCLNPDSPPSRRPSQESRSLPLSLRKTVNSSPNTRLENITVTQR
jgi:Type II secretion system (T2SS), protein E, N-terminal domain